MSDYILNLLPVNEEEKAQFETIAPQAVHMYAGRNSVTEEQLAAATVIFGWPKAEDLSKTTQLKWLQTMWAGSDEYVDVMPEGAVLTSSSGSNARSVAEHMLASLLSLCRRLPTYRDLQREHDWADEGRMRTLLDANVLVLGAGHIGSVFGQMCRGLGAHTIGLKRKVGPVEGFDQVASMDRLEELLPWADVVALTLPHSPGTVNLMDRERLGLMKDDAMLLSAGRGSVLDQEALAELMKGGKLWGAALDVTTPEPLPKDSPLWDIPNLLLTPHVAGGMRLECTRVACVKLAQDNLRRYLNGEDLENRVL